MSLWRCELCPICTKNTEQRVPHSLIGCFVKNKNKKRDVLELNLSQNSAALFLAASASLLTLIASAWAASNAAWTYGRVMTTMISAPATTNVSHQISTSKLVDPQDPKPSPRGTDFSLYHPRRFNLLKQMFWVGGGWVVGGSDVKMGCTIYWKIFPR